MVAPKDKIYQVFISSTYKDLVEERKGAIEAILNSGCIPMGMEIFPASDGDPLAHIKEVIDYCDYYVLIISEEYGTVRKETGKSYTEEEFEYAVSVEKTVLVFINKNVEEITAKDISENPEKEKLKQFIDRASSVRLRKTWSSMGDLKYEISSALYNQRKIGNAVGWIRADQGDSKELMSKYIALDDENKKLKQELETMIDQSVKSDFIDKMLNDDLTSSEMIVIHKILEKDCATVYVNDFFDNNKKNKSSDKAYTHGDINSAMMQLARMGVGQALMYNVEQIERFSLNDKEFRQIRKNKEVRDKLGL